MNRKPRNYFASALIAGLTAAVIIEVCYFGFRLPVEDVADKRKQDDLAAKQRREQAAIEQQIVAQSVRH